MVVYTSRIPTAVAAPATFRYISRIPTAVAAPATLRYTSRIPTAVAAPATSECGERFTLDEVQNYPDSWTNTLAAFRFHLIHLLPHQIVDDAVWKPGSGVNIILHPKQEI